MKKLFSENKSAIIRVVVSALLLAAAAVLRATLFATSPWWGALALFLPSYLLIGGDVLARSVRNIAHGEVFDENFLMSAATIGALALGEYPEAVLVMLLYQVGELFNDIAVDRSRESISALMDIRPDTANVLRDGSETRVSPSEVRPGETIIIRPGERVPLDGLVTDGSSTLDTSALTGEALPRPVAPGDEVISGCVNRSGRVTVTVTRAYHDSTVAKILALVEDAGDKKARSETFITRFARVYTPAVVFGALALAVLPPLAFGGEWSVWVYRALMFLVVSCPCALVISVPLSFFAGIGGAARRGILVKGARYFEALANCDTIVFDKTGTLTEGRFTVVAVHPDGMKDEDLLTVAAAAEHGSNHPISECLREACPISADKYEIIKAEEIAGMGLRVTLADVSDGETDVCLGNGRLMDSVGVDWHECSRGGGTVVHIAINGVYAGHIVIDDVVKEDAAAAVSELHALGVRRAVMLTGDREEVGKTVSGAVGLDEYHAALLPDGKVECVEKMLEGLAGRRRATLAFVGDGINDAPVLTRADVGIAMGALGSDAAIEAADIVLMDDKPSKLPVAVRAARRTLSIARQNIVFALAVKAAVLVLGALGLASMWLAVFADVGVSVIAVLNAVRAMKV